MNATYDVIIIGAGAAGLFCSFNLAQRGYKVLVLDHANKVGKKILMSGGGRCNFTNLNTTPEDFYSQNPHFCKSALSQYTPYDFLHWVESHHLEHVEKAAGQLFCKGSSKDMLGIILDECSKSGVKIYKKCKISKISKQADKFILNTSIESFEAPSLVVATGGLSIPTLGASGFGYEIAKQFGHSIVQTEASLVPFVLPEKLLKSTASLAGVAVPVEVCCGKTCISDDMLFTHRGLSGPAILKISMYWKPGNEVSINLMPGNDISEILEENRKSHPESQLKTILGHYLPKRLCEWLLNNMLETVKIKQVSHKQQMALVECIHNWHITPQDTEGYRTAEVTLGGIATDEVSSKTMESKREKNLYFIWEVLDVTGQLGGYNFQWAWSSAWCAAQAI